MPELSWQSRGRLRPSHLSCGLGERYKGLAPVQPLSPVRGALFRPAQSGFLPVGPCLLRRNTIHATLEDMRLSATMPVSPQPMGPSRRGPVGRRADSRGLLGCPRLPHSPRPVAAGEAKGSSRRATDPLPGSRLDYQGFKLPLIHQTVKKPDTPAVRIFTLILIRLPVNDLSL